MPWALGCAQPGLSVAPMARLHLDRRPRDALPAPRPRLHGAPSSTLSCRRNGAGSPSLQETQRKQIHLEQDSAFFYLYLFICSVEIKTCPNLCSPPSRSRDEHVGDGGLHGS